MTTPIRPREMVARPDPMAGEPSDRADMFGSAPADNGDVVRVRLRRPILAGSLVVLVLVVGLLLWATFASISGAVLAAGTVRVENNSKEVRRLQGGVIERILVREGQRVRQGQPLIRFSDIQSRATVDVFQAAADNAAAQAARFEAEGANSGTIAFPPDLLARQADPRVATLLTSQRSLFSTRMTLYQTQASILRAQMQQLRTQIGGLRAQADATGVQADLIREELRDIRQLSNEGYAPKSRLLALQRNASALGGQRGSLVSEMARAQQAIGETMIQLSQLNEKRASEAAEGLQTAQGQLTEMLPKLRATQDELRQTQVFAPADGFVFNLTQFTEGGVAGAGDRLMNIVPVGTPLIVQARVHPTDIADVRQGMPARITLTAYNPRTTPPIEGRVTLVAADATSDERTGEPFYLVQIQVAPSELLKAGPNVRLSPGMPAQVAIVTGDRTILDYLLEPFTVALRSSLRER